MRAALSVVIPTLNAGQTLPACLSALFEGVRAGLIREVVLSDGGSTDETCAIAEAAGAVIVAGSPSRGAQLRRGAGVAQGDWLLFLHADTVLPEGWSEVAQAQMAQGDAAAFRLSFDASGAAPRIVAAWANLRTGLFGLPYGDQGLLISRGDHDRAGGYADIPLMEDVAIARALRGRITLLPLAVRTSASRFVRDGWLRRGARNLWLLVRFLCGANPEWLAERYRRR